MHCFPMTNHDLGISEVVWTKEKSWSLNYWGALVKGYSCATLPRCFNSTIPTVKRFEALRMGVLATWWRQEVGFRARFFWAWSHCLNGYRQPGENDVFIGDLNGDSRTWEMPTRDNAITLTRQGCDTRQDKGLNVWSPDHQLVVKPVSDEASTPSKDAMMIDLQWSPLTTRFLRRLTWRLISRSRWTSFIRRRLPSYSERLIVPQKSQGWINILFII